MGFPLYQICSLLESLPDAGTQRIFPIFISGLMASLYGDLGRAERQAEGQESLGAVVKSTTHRAVITSSALYME